MPDAWASSRAAWRGAVAAGPQRARRAAARAGDGGHHLLDGAGVAHHLGQLGRRDQGGVETLGQGGYRHPELRQRLAHGHAPDRKTFMT